MSFRAVEMLKSASVIACEDTRHTRKLLNHFDIRDVPVVAVHEHNEAQRASEMVERIGNGETVALVTDAGMPGISDPGSRAVAAVAAAGLTVTAVPGASALTMAVAISGLPTERFVFEGFLPRKGSERSARLRLLATETRTTVFYESPNRVLATLQAIRDVAGGDRRVALCRELTKLYEEVRRGALDALIAELGDVDLKGECVLVLEGAAEREVDDDAIRAFLAEVLATGVSKRDAIAHTVEALDVAKNRVYDIAQQQ
jgi:16S rRNA (cytidine1402-2'-O)-methyltransferase